MGRQAYPEVNVAFPTFSSAVLARTATWSPAEGEALDRQLAALAGADLYLAQACDGHVASAWARLRADYMARLVATAIRRGHAKPSAEDLADDLFSDLALPPPRGGAASRIGTFTGRGSLYAFLATLLTRRGVDQVRARQRRRLHPSPVEVAAAGHAGSAADPLAELLGVEVAGTVATVLDAALATCTERERLVLALKHADGLAQRDIAALLGVGAPRVSRLIKQATRRIRDHIETHSGLKSVHAGAGADWDAICERVRKGLATTNIAPRPSHERDPS